MMPKLQREFTQEEARELYTTLYTLVYALRDIVNRGLTVESIKEFSTEIAIHLASLQRVLFQAEHLIEKLDTPVVAAVKAAEPVPDQPEEKKAE